MPSTAIVSGRSVGPRLTPTSATRAEAGPDGGATPATVWAWAAPTLTAPPLAGGVPDLVSETQGSLGSLARIGSIGAPPSRITRAALARQLKRSVAAAAAG